MILQRIAISNDMDFGVLSLGLGNIFLEQQIYIYILYIYIIYIYFYFFYYFIFYNSILKHKG